MIFLAFPAITPCSYCFIIPSGLFLAPRGCKTGRYGDPDSVLFHKVDAVFYQIA